MRVARSVQIDTYEMEQLSHYDSIVAIRRKLNHLTYRNAEPWIAPFWAARQIARITKDDVSTTLVNNKLSY